MKRKGLVVLALLIVASLMAAMGTGALDVFSAKRQVAMQVVDDTEGLVSIKGDGLYAKLLEKGNSDKKQKAGEINLDFTNTSFGGKGFNINALFEFHDVLTITNKSEKTIYVWLESPNWQTTHTHGVVYRVGKNEGGRVEKDQTAVPDNKWKLLWKGWNFKDGVGKLAYVELDPGDYFTVNIEIDTTQYYASAYQNNLKNWDHTIVIKADVNAPSRP